MKLADRIKLLRQSILISKITKPSGIRRNPKEILEVVLTRTAIQDAYLQDRGLEEDFMIWQKENLEKEKTL